MWLNEPRNWSPRVIPILIPGPFLAMARKAYFWILWATKRWVGGSKDQMGALVVPLVTGGLLKMAIRFSYPGKATRGG